MNEFRPVYRPHVTALDWSGSFEDALLALRDLQGLVALDSAGGRPNRFSLIAFEPVRTADGWSSLEDLRREMSGGLVSGDIPGPFHGGFLGALSYDLGVSGEALDLPVEPWHFPRIVGGIYTDFLVFDHASKERFLVLSSGQGRKEREDKILAMLNSRGSPKPFGVGTMERHTSSTEHQRRIEIAREEIAAGEYYQVNLAHRFTAPMQGAPLDLYLRLRKTNPAPYGGFLQFAEGSCMSTSPELLMDFDGQQVVTRPIKGTAPRDLDAKKDAELAAELLRSEKDLAELAMIVDLERNDLGRIAQPGTVRVDQFPELATYARVHHLEATVRAKQKEGVDSIDILRSLFPGGSITGAPKLASMEAIAQLEGEGRGLFTGSLGFIDFRGHSLFNILIRTVLWRPVPGMGDDRGEISFRVGGGITYASVAADEDAETLHKAQGMTDAWS